MGLKTRGNHYKSPVLIGLFVPAFAPVCPTGKLTRSAYIPVG
ncbi:hypothetical protein SAMN06272735_7324 [Streptomyces sp. TLI_55]|nr:hypothetical protein SAMN06272735_7324 [Streptomyces sp. TLI_55]